MWSILGPIGAVSIVAALCPARHFGHKLRKLACQEKEAFDNGEWSPPC
jgi:hypothetical protein